MEGKNVAMKAWKVWMIDNELEYTELIWAETRGKAIYNSEAYGDCRDWTQVRARREPFFDDKPNPTDRQIKEGGWLPLCHYCHEPIYENEGDYDGSCLYFDENDRAYHIGCKGRENIRDLYIRQAQNHNTESKV